MKSISFYNEMGEIIAVCRCQDDDALQATIEANNHSFLYGEYSSDEFYVDNGEPVSFPEKPNEDYSWDWEAKEWKINLSELSSQAIRKRNKLLQESDWTQLPDAPADKSSWAIYRQHLRDISGQPDFPIKIDWGTSPSEE